MSFESSRGYEWAGGSYVEFRRRMLKYSKYSLARMATMHYNRVNQVVIRSNKQYFSIADEFKDLSCSYLIDVLYEYEVEFDKQFRNR